MRKTVPNEFISRQFHHLKVLLFIDELKKFGDRHFCDITVHVWSNEFLMNYTFHSDLFSSTFLIIVTRAFICCLQ